MQISRVSIALILFFAIARVAGAATSDDFTDNQQGSQWSLISDAPSLKLEETNTRLELISTGPTLSTTDAIYLSDPPATGFAMSTLSDFEIAIDYSFTGYQTSGSVGQAMALVFGVGVDVDGFNSAAIGFGYATQIVNIPGLGSLTVTGFGARAAHRTGDIESPDGEQLAAAKTGTFVIRYDAAGDDLFLSLQDTPTPIGTITNTVQGVWHANSLLVSFGGRGNGFTTQSGDAFLDNFVVRSGTIVPEPAALSFLTITGLTLRRTRVRHGGQ